ncbi:MAG: ferrous iron transport protein B [Microcoleaceae cyanobacterium]
MTCHTPTTTPSSEQSATQRVALIGMPNTGKSTFFNRITKANTSVGNWPGVTVDLLQAEVVINGQPTEFIDLPGIYDLNGFSEDETVVQTFLEQYTIDLVILVLNASQIDRQIRLALQIKDLGLPAILLLNMADEAEQYGIEIDTKELSEKLDFPTILISAKYGKGYMNAYEEICQKLKSKQATATPINHLKSRLAELNTVSTDQIDALLQDTVKIPSETSIHLTEKIDRFLLHPLLGLPLFFLGMFAVFWLIWSLGLPAQDIVDNLTEWIQTTCLEPLLQPLPNVIQDFIINGIWNGIATVTSFVPLILLFFVIMAILEDSGYLSRSAYLMDGIMAKIGLDGRSFVMQMMGFGCNVPALMGTRVMRSRALRLLTMLVIPFALCSARLQVFVFIIAATFPNKNGAIVLFSLYLISFIAAILTAALFQEFFKNEEPFILELPPYRFPTLQQVLLRSWGEVQIFLKRASGLILFGCIAVWFVTNLPPNTTGLETIGGQIGQFLSPVMQPIGLDPYLTLALIFGFIAKEVVIGSLAVIYGLNSALVSQQITESVTFIQGYSFCLFCLLYTPCLTTIVTLLNESKSAKFTIFSLIFSLVLAWVASFIFYQSALLLGYS